jgi:hemerythrin-like metal-binding protein
MVLQSLGNAVLSGAPRPEVIEILNSAIEFCVLHFEDEEGFMRKHGYSGLAGHAAAHKRMLAKFRGMRRRATGSGISMATLDAVDLLHDFHEHVNTWDRCAFLAIENDPHGTVYSHRS